MGKVKSAIITALLVAAIIVLALFATISCDVPGSNGVKRYNSFISSISLGSELTGDASVVFYPEGVITEDDYNRAVENEKKVEEYQKKYEYFEAVGLYVDKDKLTDEDGNNVSAQFVESIKEDAKIISDRIAQKGYSSYSVAVIDTYGIKVTVPTKFTYAAYKGNDNAARSAALSEVESAMSYLSVDGKLKLQFDDGTDYFDQYDEFDTYIKSANTIVRSGTSAIRIKLTNKGFEKFNEILATSAASSAILYVGDTSLGLSFTVGEELTDKTLAFAPSNVQKYAIQDCAILVNSVANGNVLTNKYTDASLVELTPVYGEYAAVALAALVLFLVFAVAILPIIKYKKLGIVNAIMVCAYTVAMATAIMLTGVELTIGGVFTALLGLALLSFSNFFTFEAVRRESALGRTISASVKVGYKKSMFGVIDVHVILVIAAALMALIGAGELAACGLIFLIGSLASFVLYWLTRFMWFVISSPVRNKFAFCGFAREVEEDE